MHVKSGQNSSMPARLVYEQVVLGSIPGWTDIFTKLLSKERRIYECKCEVLFTLASFSVVARVKFSPRHIGVLSPKKFNGATTN